MRGREWIGLGPTLPDSFKFLVINLSVNLMKHNGLIFHRYFSYLISVFCKLLFVFQKRVVDWEPRDILDFPKR